MTPKGYRVTGVKIPSSDAIILWNEFHHLYITAIPQRLSFKPGYVLQVGLTSALELVSIL